MRRTIFSGVGLIVLIVIAVLVYLSLFIVNQTQQALVLRFGQVVAPLGGQLQPVSKPGLYYKLPLIDNVVYFEKRILDLDSPPLEIIASDQKRLVVDAFGRYKIVDPLLFYQAVGTEQGANERLSSVLNSAIRRVLGDATFIQVVRDERATLMGKITQQVDQEAKRLGIEMVDVKIRRADLPAENSEAIYQRMQTERQRQATEIRAQGEQAARGIRADADRQVTVIIADANGDAQRVQGEGDAERNRIFADAYNKDPEFFDFYRSMLAYQNGLKPGSTRLVMSPDSEFFRYFSDPLGKDLPGAPLAPLLPSTPEATSSTPPAGTSAAPAVSAPAVPAAPAAQ
ncbi:MAG TPA: protease modulator HflC [Bauldia sp.]|nr:protease modulator HflC [Bauldia sp.]